MKVLFLNPYFPPWAPGGAEHSLEEMCKNFAKNGWEVEVLAVAFDQRKADEARDNYWIRWIKSPFAVQPGQDINAEHYFRSKHYRLAVLERFKKMDRPDVIVANNAQAYVPVNHIARKFRIPSIGIVRDTQMLCEFGTCMDNQSAKDARPCRGFLGAARCSVRYQRERGVGGWRPLPAWAVYGFQMHLRRLKLRSVIKHFNHIVTISDALHELVKNSLPVLDSHRLTTIRNFSTQVEPADRRVVNEFMARHDLMFRQFFLFAGKKTYGKGADILVAATEIARKKNQQCQSLFVGRGRVCVKIGPGCIDSDSVPRDLLLGLLGQSAALVIPGRWQEGLHRTMIDAIRLGIPIICTQAGAPSVDGVVNRKNGIVCDCSDPFSLAASMADVFNWDQERRNHCRYESEKIFSMRFAEEANAEKWSEIFLNLKHREKNIM